MLMLKLISVVIPNIMKKQDKTSAFISGTLNEIKYLRYFESLFLKSCRLCKGKTNMYVMCKHYYTYVVTGYSYIFIKQQKVVTKIRVDYRMRYVIIKG